ncbi:hypothetical protein NMG60_11024515 [Bertholletia excelsa]
MAEQHSTVGSSTSDVGGESLELVELNIKTLDSQIYSFQVDKNMPVSQLKEKIASESGLPVGQQRLIFRGKVLKDDHLLSEYHVENGHTLHLVARQPSESQLPGSGSGETSVNTGNRGQDANASGPRNRIGQISHSVVLGTLNVGEQAEGIVPDISRVIGAVLNSIGIGSQTPAGFVGGVPPNMQFSTPVQAPQGNETDGSRNAGTQSQSGNHSQTAPTAPTFPVQSLPQAMQVPLGAAIPVPSLNAPIPDSLHTLSEFMNRMERALSQNGYQPNQPPASVEDIPTVELPSGTRGLSTPEALGIVLRHAQRLLNGHAVAALSHIAGRLEAEGSSTDSTVRGQIQTEAMQAGLAMQHLGALFLELGRTILTLRMGLSPTESYVNAGPAVYISSSGPNPIMVQPFPLQTHSLFGSAATGPSNPGTFSSVGVGNIPRHVNIHIHTALGPRGSNSEGTQGERGNRNVSGDSGQTRLPRDPVAMSTVIVGNMQNENQASSGNSTTQNPSSEPAASLSEGNNQQQHLADRGAGGAGQSGTGIMLEGEGQKLGDKTECALWSDQGNHNPEGTTTVPLGLGMGGLQPKRRSKQVNSQSKVGVSDGETSGASSQKQETRVNSQQLLQTLASVANMRNASVPSSAQMPPMQAGSERRGGQATDGNSDAASVMSQVINSPALDGLLAGVSQQTGVGSPNVLRNMLTQLTQSPAMRNTINQMAQQFDNQDIGNMFSGSGRGQGGGIDLASMFQQMMPIVSQTLGGGSAIRLPMPAGGPDTLPPHSERSSIGDDIASGQTSQVDLEKVVQTIEHQNPQGEIFRSMVESAVCLCEGSSGAEDLMNELCNEDGLANEYMEILHRDLSQRLQEERGFEEKS